MWDIQSLADTISLAVLLCENHCLDVFIVMQVSYEGKIEKPFSWPAIVIIIQLYCLSDIIFKIVFKEEMLRDWKDVNWKVKSVSMQHPILTSQRLP